MTGHEMPSLDPGRAWSSLAVLGACVAFWGTVALFIL
jgi:hypothetical protein